MENVDTAEKKATLDDLLLHAIEQRPADFQDTFNDLLTQRIQARLDQAKQEVAASYFDQGQEEGQDEEVPAAEDKNSEETTDEVQDGQDTEAV